MQEIKRLKENMDFLVTLLEDGACSLSDREKEAVRLLWENYNKLLKEEIIDNARFLSKS